MAESSDYRREVGHIKSLNTNYPIGAETSSTDREQSVHSVVSTATTPTAKMGYKHELKDWIKATPLVQRWYDRLDRRAHATARTYVDNLYQYWRLVLVAIVVLIAILAGSASASGNR